MMSMIEVIAGIGWEPEIRGLLTVALAWAILGGSVWLLLVTNTGTRLGSLIALAGFWGWMFVMGIFWWIYGIGWVGAQPSWEVEDVFIDDPGAEVAGIGDAFVGNVGDLPDVNCFPAELLAAVDEDHAALPAPASFPPVGGVAAADLASIDDDLVALCTPRAIDVLMAYDGADRESIIRELLNPQTDESKIENIVDSLGFDVIGADGESFTLGPLKSLRDSLVGDQSSQGRARFEELSTQINGIDLAATLESLSASQRDQVFDAIVDARYNELADNVIANNDALGPEDPRFLDATPNPLSGFTLDERIAIAQDAQTLRTDNLTLTALEGAAPQVIEWAEEQGLLDLDGWTLQSASEAGEATATADAFLRDELFSDGNFVVLDAFQQGGKPPRENDDLLSRLWFKVTDAARIKNPTNYTVINVQQTIEQAANPALPPPVPVADPDEPVYSVVLIRDLGNLRVIPALFTIVSLLLFLATCLVLHWRDLALREKGIDS